MTRRQKEKDRLRKRREREKDIDNHTVQTQSKNEETHFPKSLHNYMEDQKRKSIQQKAAYKKWYAKEENRHAKKTYMLHKYFIPNISERKKQKMKEKYSNPDVAATKKQKMKEKYSNPVVASAKKQNMKEKYSNPVVAATKKQKIQEKYSNPEVAAATKQKMKEQYSNPVVAAAKKQKMKEQYSNPHVAASKKQKIQEKYSNPEVAAATKQKMKEQYSNPVVAAAKKQKMKEQYSNPHVAASKKQKIQEKYSNPEVAAATKQKMKEQYSNPVVAAAKKQKMKEQYSNPHVAASKKQKIQEKYSNPEVAAATKQKMKEQYSNPVVAAAKKQKMKEQYSNPHVAASKKQKIQEKYSNPEVAAATKQKMKEQYSNPVVAAAKKQKMKEQYSNPHVAASKKQKIQEKYSNPEVAAATKQKMKEQYSNPVVAAAKKQKMKEQYSNPHVAASKKQKIQEKYANPEVAAATKQKMKEQYSNPVVAAAKKQKMKEQYSNPHVAASKKQKIQEKYSNPEVAAATKQKMKEQYSNPVVAAAKKQKMKKNYSKPVVAAAKKQKMKKRYKTQGIKKVILAKKTLSNTTKSFHSRLQKSIKVFKGHCKDFPMYICCVCGRTLFQQQVTSFSSTKYKKNLMSCYTKVRKQKDKDWICFTCHRNLKQGKVPAQALVNNMKLPDIPEQLDHLNVLERHLISPVIPFMKIVVLPKTSQKGIHGPVTCVHADIVQTMNCLPRPISDETLIKIKLKRKLSYKGHHLYQQVNPQKLFTAAEYLKTHNKLFEKITLIKKEFFCEDSEKKPFSYDNETKSELLGNQETIQSENVSVKQENVNSPPYTCQQQQDERKKTTVLQQQNQQSPQNENKTQTMNSMEQPNQSDDQQLSMDSTDNLTDEEETGTTAPLYTSLQPVNMAQHVGDMYEDLILSVAPGEKYKPIPVLQHEAESFPYHFSLGTGTFSDSRNTKLTLKRYLNARLFSYDQRFASDPQYIFFAQYSTEMNDILSSISIAVRKSSADIITPDVLKETKSLRQFLKHDEGFRFLQNVRGSPMYWERTMRDTFAMLRQIGLPTFFITLSAADRRWPEIIQSICAQQGKCVPDNMDWSTYCSIINSNIVTATRMFDKRLHSFINDIIMSPAKPIGQVLDMFGRIEFQARGLPHYHGLIWIKDAPVFQNSTSVEIAKFVDQYICCDIPPQSDKELHDIVTTVQMHSKRHSKSCQKGGKECRFNFPRPPSANTFITNTDTLEKERKTITKEQAQLILQTLRKGVHEHLDTSQTTDEFFRSIGINQSMIEDSFNTISTKTSVIYKRSPADIWVNTYNPILLRAWNGNMDIQYVTDPYSCIMYIISYITKAERELSQTIKSAQKEARQEGNSDSVSELRRLGHIYMTHRDVSVMEAVYRTCGLPLKICTREVVWLPSDPQSTRLTLPLQVLQSQSPESDNVWMTNIVDRYKARPLNAEFNDMCLADFASNFRVIAKQASKQSSETNESTPNSHRQRLIPLLDNMGFISKRLKKPAVIRYPRLHKEKDPERYFANIICLFLPHRQLLKPANFESYESFYENGVVSFSESTNQLVSNVVLTNMSQYETLKDNLEDTWEEMKEMNLEDAWGTIAPSTDKERDDIEYEKVLQQDFTLDSNEEPIPELSVPSSLSRNTNSINRCDFMTNIDSMQPKLRSLNEKQQEVFNYIRHWCLQKIHGQNPPPFHIFINGGAGTGKSHLIQCLYYESSKILQRQLDNPDDVTVMLVAFTGTAVFNIYGQTVHSSFSIKTTSLPYQHLNDDNLNTLRTKLEKVSILIIDEVSMISKSLLQYVSGRLQQIKKHLQSKPFGDVSVVTVGDFYQLPPVHEQILYKQDPGALPIDLWSYFHIFTLTEIMRQKNDQDFALMLNRLRTKLQTENISQTDHQSLQNCVVNGEYPENAIHIFATNKRVHDHNMTMLHKLSSTVVTIQAADIVQSKKGKCYHRNTPDPNLQSSLKTTLELSEKARVMLTMNLDVSDGLVNGVIGTVEKIITGSQPHGLPEHICVKFDDANVGINLRSKYQHRRWLPDKAVPLSASTDRIKTKIMDITRHMYPLVLAWACTIHKVQGKTFDEIAVSMDGIFRAGMAYVAISRAKSINGLYLLDYDEKYIYADPNVNTALCNMPQLLISPGNPLNNIDKKSFVIVHHNIQSLPAHYQDIALNKQILKASIICLTETWISNHEENYVNIHYQLPGYTNVSIIPKDPQRSKSSGIVSYFKDNCTFEIVQTCSNPTLELVTFKLEIPEVLLLTVIYRHPNHNLPSFQSIPNEILQISKHLKINTILVMGDFNQDILHTNNQYITQCFTNAGFSQLIKKPTTLAGTCLDHIYVHNTSTTDSGIMSTYYSYHDPVFINLKPTAHDSEHLPKPTVPPANDVTLVQSIIQPNTSPSVKNVQTPTPKSISSCHNPTKTRGKKKKVKKLLQSCTTGASEMTTAVEEILGFQSDINTPTFPLQHPVVVPPGIVQQAKYKYVRIIDMWSGNRIVQCLADWLSTVGFNVIPSLSNLQVGPSCGYIAAHIAWTLHKSSDWKTQNVQSALDPQLIKNYNVILNKHGNTPYYLTDNEILAILSHVQYSESKSSTLNWIDGPMPLNYLIQSFRNDFTGQRRRRTRQHNFKICIVNTTPVTNVFQNLQASTISGDHWIVVASSL